MNIHNKISNVRLTAFSWAYNYKSHNKKELLYALQIYTSMTWGNS